MKVVDVIKRIGGLIISIGIGAATANIIKNTTPADTQKIVKICIGIGSYFIAGLASKTASNNFSSTVDELAGMVNDITEENKNATGGDENIVVSEA